MLCTHKTTISLPVWIILSPAHHHVSINSQPFLVGIVSQTILAAFVCFTHPSGSTSSATAMTSSSSSSSSIDVAVSSSSVDIAVDCKHCCHHVEIIPACVLVLFFIHVFLFPPKIYDVTMSHEKHCAGHAPPSSTKHAHGARMPIRRKTVS